MEERTYGGTEIAGMEAGAGASVGTGWRGTGLWGMGQRRICRGSGGEWGRKKVRRKKNPMRKIEEKINRGYYCYFIHMVYYMKLFCRIIFLKQLSFTKKAPYEAIFAKRIVLMVKLSCVGP
jgi:hypothetical protein